MQMKIQSNIILFILFSFWSCGYLGNNAAPAEALKNEQESNLSNDQDLAMPAKIFAQKLLESNLGIKTIYFSESKGQDYDQIFSREGITQIVAYYDKKAKHSNQATKFEDYLLFVASYEDSSYAKSAFERIKSDAVLSNSTESIKTDKMLSNRIELLRLGDKYGGLITYNKNQVFSLVENCDMLPMGKSWLECEYMFTDLLKNEKGYVEVLKAGCEEGRYYGGRRKARS